MKWKRLLVLSAVIAGSLLLLIAVVLVALWRASQSVPEFYSRLLAEDRTAQRSASDSMIQKTTLLVGDVQKSGRWEMLFSEEEINGWLAVDLEENHSRSLPPGIADPRVVVQPGSLQWACRTQLQGVETVLSAQLDVHLQEPGVLGVRVRHLRAGSIPLPLTGLLDRIGELGDRRGLRIQWQQTEGDPVALIHIDPVIEDNKPVVIDSVELAEGEIYVSGTTQDPPKPDR